MNIIQYVNLPGGKFKWNLFINVLTLWLTKSMILCLQLFRQRWLLLPRPWTIPSVHWIHQEPSYHPSPRSIWSPWECWHHQGQPGDTVCKSNFSLFLIFFFFFFFVFFFYIRPILLFFIWLFFWVHRFSWLSQSFCRLPWLTVMSSNNEPCPLLTWLFVCLFVFKSYWLDEGKWSEVWSGFKVCFESLP